MGGLVDVILQLAEHQRGHLGDGIRTGMAAAFEIDPHEGLLARCVPTGCLHPEAFPGGGGRPRVLHVVLLFRLRGLRFRQPGRAGR
jgi:hypothetical protein